MAKKLKVGDLVWVKVKRADEDETLGGPGNEAGPSSSNIQEKPSNKQACSPDPLDDSSSVPVEVPFPDPVDAPSSDADDNSLDFRGNVVGHSSSNIQEKPSNKRACSPDPLDDSSSVPVEVPFPDPVDAPSSDEDDNSLGFPGNVAGPSSSNMQKKPYNKRTLSPVLTDDSSSDSEEGPSSDSSEVPFSDEDENVLGALGNVEVVEDESVIETFVASHFPGLQMSPVRALCNIISRDSEKPETPPLYFLDGAYEKREKINPTKKKIGFLGLGTMGQTIVKNLNKIGHSMVIWNRSPEKCKPFIGKLNMKVASSPADVVASASITFSCVSNADAAKAIFYGENGVLVELKKYPRRNKGYVELTTMDPETINDIANHICVTGCRFLAAPLNGSKNEAIKGTLNIIASGSKTLYDDCNSCFKAISKMQRYLSPDFAYATKINIARNMFYGSAYAGLAEGWALFKSFEDSTLRLNVDSEEEFLEMGNPNDTDDERRYERLTRKQQLVAENDDARRAFLNHMIKSLGMGLEFGNSINAATHITAAAYQAFKRYKRFSDDYNGDRTK